jgi:3,4-dihydroxy 2-butanone 4-phosphate synthase/GTP cyclohydrolase II
MSISTIENAVKAISEGRMVIVIDDARRENEANFVVAAEVVAGEHVAFMLRWGRGQISASMKVHRLDELEIPAIASQNKDPYRTVCAVSVDCTSGKSSARSATDHAATIRALVDQNSRASASSRPGYVFPLLAREHGVFGQAGLTKAVCDLVRLAGFAPAGAFCEIANHNGIMNNLADLEQFAQEHRLPIVTIVALQEFIESSTPRITRIAQSKMPTRYGSFKAISYRDNVSNIDHIVLVHGEIDKASQVIVRVHSECLTGEAFGSLRCDCGDQLKMALEIIQKEPAGCLVYLRGQEGRGIGLGKKIQAYELQDEGLDTFDANTVLGELPDARDYRAAACILKDLGVRDIVLLTNNPDKVAALANDGLVIKKRRSLITKFHASSMSYLRTKRDRFGHLLT